MSMSGEKDEKAEGIVDSLQGWAGGCRSFVMSSDCSFLVYLLLLLLCFF